MSQQFGVDFSTAKPGMRLIDFGLPPAAHIEDVRAASHKSVWQKEDYARWPAGDLKSAHGLPSSNFWADIKM
jgi:hypothetical protein